MKTEKKNYAELETMCELRYSEAGSCFHVCSQENHPVLFHNDDEFKASMNTVAFVAFLFSDIRIFTFEIMSNHFHFLLCGERGRIELFYKTVVSKLATHPLFYESSGDIKNLTFNVYEIDSLNNLRNVIAYINRNGAVTDYDENVFTYQWGANRYFFNRDAVSRFRESAARMTTREKRTIFRSNLLANQNGIAILDNYVSPMSYCHINEAELFFRNNRHYFYCISRNIEASHDIAKIIGENVFYTDDDLFSYIRSLCMKKYGNFCVAELPKEAKIELARTLHFDYNAGNKQISRLLKMNLTIVNTLFPDKS